MRCADQVLQRGVFWQGGQIISARVSVLSWSFDEQPLLDGTMRDALQFYATGPRPDLAQSMGVIGGKMPLRHGPAEGVESLRKNLDALGLSHAAGNGVL